ncbi:MAG: ATPase [Firmicutes bacterium]|nr:ATPase [Bacillota bacterium]
MVKGHIKRVFPGGNTSQGFYSYYDYILGQEEASRIFVLKGGPGVGKSTFMRSIGMEMVNRGYDVEFMHCSSDNNSLDGVVIPALKVALVDGTAPHIVDPKNPGAVDEIIHLGDFWDYKGIRENREAILKDNMEVRRLFDRAYRYIKAAACFYEDNAVIYGWAMDAAQVNILAKRWSDEIFAGNDITDKEGKQRHLFASAITPDGVKNYLDTVLTTKRIYAVKGYPGTGTEKLLEKIRHAALERGFYTESYYCALHPQKIEHLLIPEADVSFTTVNDYHDVNVEKFSEINLNQFLDKLVLEKYSDVLEFNMSQFNFLLQKAVETIKMAKAVHDRIEKHYIGNMDFEAKKRCMEATLAEILEEASPKY